MASVTLSNANERAELAAYEALRNRARQALANGVYPNCVAVLAAYQDLVGALSGDMGKFAAWHAQETSAVVAHIDTIQGAAQLIVDTMRAIETAAPGTFGIELPSEDA